MDVWRGWADGHCRRVLLPAIKYGSLSVGRSSSYFGHDLFTQVPLIYAFLLFNCVCHKIFMLHRPGQKHVWSSYFRYISEISCLMHCYLMCVGSNVTTNRCICRMQFLDTLCFLKHIPCLCKISISIFLCYSYHHYTIQHMHALIHHITAVTTTCSGTTMPFSDSTYNKGIQANKYVGSQSAMLDDILMNYCVSPAGPRGRAF